MGIYDVFEGGSQPFDKAAWIAKKNEEKQAAYELADSTADRMKTDGDAFRSYLDVQGRFDRYSVTNAILVAAQKPDATQLKDYKKWREDGVTIDKDATKITILEPGNEYTRHDGTRTIYLMFQNEYSANFLHTLWKRVRKYGAFCTGITQNVEDLLQSHTARTMLSNSELLVMLNQSGNDMDRLAELLNISNTQRSFMENVGPGQGLLKVGSSLVPFVNQFPTNTSLYKLMSTKINE